MSGIYKAIIKTMSDISSIGKDKVNTTQRFNFRGIDDVYNHLHPLLVKNEIFTIPEVLEHNREERVTKNGGFLLYTVIKMKYTFIHSDGSNISAIVIGEAMDSGDKASNKAMSIAHKYALLQIFAIPTKETDDPDKEVHKVAPVGTPEEGLTLNEYLKAKKVKDIKGFALRYGVKSKEDADKLLGNKKELDNLIKEFLGNPPAQMP